MRITESAAWLTATDIRIQRRGGAANGKRIEYHFDSFVKGTSPSVCAYSDADSYGVDLQNDKRCRGSARAQRKPGLLFANLENTFVTASIMRHAGHDAFEADPVTEADLEAFADLFDFTAIRAADTPIDPPKHDLIVLQGYPTAGV
jgi:hypothetical protein